VGRHNFATIDDAANTLGLTAEKGRIAGKLIREVAEDARDLLSVSKSAREAGIPKPAIIELIRRGMDLRERLDIDAGYLAKAAPVPPPPKKGKAKGKPEPVGQGSPIGTVKRHRESGLDHRKVADGKWEPVKGPNGKPGEKPGAPPKNGGKPDLATLRGGKTAKDRFKDITNNAKAAGKRIHGDFDDEKHSHLHMDHLENQLKEHIANGLSQSATPDAPPEGEQPGGKPPFGAQLPGAQPPVPGQEGALNGPPFSGMREAADRHAKVQEAMRELDKKLAGAPVVNRVWHGLKNNAKEFPDAADAIGKLKKGEPLDKHDMESIVAIGAMVGTTAVVASGHGAMAGKATLSNKLLTHVALAALHAHLNNAYTAYAGLGFVHKMADVAEGYKHGGVAGDAYHAADSAVHKAAGKPPFQAKEKSSKASEGSVSSGKDERQDGPKAKAKDGKADEHFTGWLTDDGTPDGASKVDPANETELKKLVKGMIKQMQEILRHEWTPDEIEAAEGGEGDDSPGNDDDSYALGPGVKNGQGNGEKGPNGNGDQEGAGDDDAEPPRPKGHDSPEQPHEQHRQTQEVHDLISTLDAIESRLDSAHQKGMFKELKKQAKTVVKDPSPQAIEWLGKRIKSFAHLVTGISGTDDNGEDIQPEPVKKALFMDPRSGRLLLKAGGAGSRGGHVIGRTASGKAIYASKKPQDYRGFTRQDHQDAADAHRRALDAAEDMHTSSDPELRAQGGAVAGQHLHHMTGHEKWVRMGFGPNVPEPVSHRKSMLQASPLAAGGTRGIDKAGDATDAVGSVIDTSVDDEEDTEEDDLEMRGFVIFGNLNSPSVPAPSAISSGGLTKARKVPPSPPLRFGLRKARAPHSVNVHGHRDDLEPGMLLHPRDRHEDAGAIEVLADGRFKVGADIVKGGHALLTSLYGTSNHRMTVRRYFNLGGERQAIARADVTEQLRTLLKADGILVQRTGDEYHLTGDLRKAGIPNYLMVTGELSTTINREAAFDLCRLLGARDV
jgi:hypothetical protein